MTATTAVRRRVQRNALEVLADAAATSKDAFHAENGFTLLERLGSEHVTEEDVLRRLEPLLSRRELQTIARHFEQRRAAYEVMAALRERQRAQQRAAEQKVLDQYAEAIPERGAGWYRFEHAWTGRMKSAQVKSFDCYRTKDGSLAGAIRVSVRGDGCTDSWSFTIKNGKMVVITDDIY